ncbi:MAG: hypothetical protein CFK49_06130 [Armatimonadetes bacterium JP3_11]|nr:MAG: hypothetical protein CFK49_06130 [Armatimonadetes bacterium JP3_11]
MDAEKHLRVIIREVVYIGGFGSYFRILLYIFQVVAALLISRHYLHSDRLREYAVNTLRSGNYRLYSKGEGVVRPFSERATAVLSKRGKWCIWRDRAGELLTFSGDCRSWRPGDKFSFEWIDAPATVDKRYVVEIVRVIFFAMNVYYFVLYDQEGNYVASLWVVWHS